MGPMPRIPPVSSSALCALGLLLCELGACARGAAERGDILLISVDTLRTDHMSAYGYPLVTTPQLSRFFREGAIFENAYATSSYTTASMVSVLSGLLPQDHGVRLFDQLLPEGVALITDLLPDAYQSAAFVSNGVLSHRGLGVGNRFDHFDDDMTRGGGSHRLERSATATTDAVVEWLDGGRDPARPLFLWVHYMDPHEPYAPPGTWARAPQAAAGAAAPEPIVRHRERRPELDPHARIRDYDAEIAYTDHEIGRMLARYAESADLEAALVILTADHGETLAERTRWFQHAYHVFEELVRVPLMLRGPGLEPGRPVTLVSGLDLLPTMLAFAGVPAAGLPGWDLRDPGLFDRESVLFVESMHGFDGSQWRAAVTPRGKWLLRVGGAPDTRILERGYFHLDRDPGEIRRVPWPRGEGPGTRLLDLVKRDPDPAGRPTAFRRGDLMQENAEILRQLGYVR
jgi:arylsulfatase